MRRPLVGAAIAVFLSACGSSPSSRELLAGTWLHEADAAQPDIPSKVTYRDDQTLEGVYEIGKNPGTFEGNWSIDNKRNFLNMALLCNPNELDPGPTSPRVVPTCGFGSVSVNYQVSAQSLTWIWGDGTQWHFHR